MCRPLRGKMSLTSVRNHHTPFFFEPEPEPEPVLVLVFGAIARTEFEYRGRPNKNLVDWNAYRKKTITVFLIMFELLIRDLVS